MDLEPVGEALGLLGRERLVERGRGVGIELVHDQDERVRLALAPVHRVADKMRPVLAPALVGDRHLAPPTERREGDEQDSRRQKGKTGTPRGPNALCSTQLSTLYLAMQRAG